MYYLKIHYIFEDIYKNFCHGFVNLFNPPPVKYRISIVERDGESHELINEKIMEDNITDVNLLCRKYLRIFKNFYKNKSFEYPEKSNSNFYVEVSEVGKKVKRISYAGRYKIGDSFCTKSVAVILWMYCPLIYFNG